MQRRSQREALVSMSRRALGRGRGEGDSPLSEKVDEEGTVDAVSDEIDERTPLLLDSKDTEPPLKSSPKYNKLRLAAKRLVAALTESLKWVLTTLASPGCYLVTGFYDEKGKFSPLLPVRKLGRIIPRRNGSKSTAQAVGLSSSPDSSNHTLSSSSDSKNTRRKAQPKGSRRKTQGANSIFSATSESEADIGEKTVLLDTPASSRPKVRASSSSEEAPRPGGLFALSFTMKTPLSGGEGRRKRVIRVALQLLPARGNSMHSR